MIIVHCIVDCFIPELKAKNCDTPCYYFLLESEQHSKIQILCTPTITYQFLFCIALIFKLKKQLVIRQGYSEYQSVQIDILKFQKYVKHVKRRKIYSLRKWFNEPLVVGCGQSSDYWLWVKSVHISSLENKYNINIRQAWFYTGFMGCSRIFLLVNIDGIVIRYYSLHSQITIDIG